MSTKKKFLFAGASSAIAQAAALSLKQHGHTVVGLSRNAVPDVYDTLFEVEEYSAAKFPSIEESIDGLVYFPGTINLKPFQRLSTVEILHDYQVNTLGAVSFVQAYLNNIKKAKTASIVFISTVAVQTGLPFHASISMAKGALEGLTRALAAEFAPAIRVNCIAPSLVSTPLATKFIDTPDKIDQMKKRNPMRKVGEPSEIANAISFLLSDDSSWITGQVLSVDGGMNVLKN